MSHHWAAVVSCWCALASACRLQVSLSCAVVLPDPVATIFSSSSLHRLAGLPCGVLLSYDLQVVIREVHRSSLWRLICPAQDHFIFFTLLIISMNFVPLPDPYIGLHIIVCDVEHTSFHFGLRGRKFVLCLFGQCPGICPIYIYNSILIWELAILKSGARMPRTVTKFAVKTAIDLTQTI